MLQRDVEGANHGDDLEVSVERNLDRIFEEVGGCGLFQAFAYIAISFGMSATSWFIYELGYYTQPPTSYVCTYTEASLASSDICTVENICSGDPRIESWQADPDSPDTLDNWQQKLDLTCVAEWEIGMIGAAFGVGWCVTLLWLPSFADKNGRKHIYWFAMLLDFFLYTGLLVTDNLGVLILLMSLFGMLSSIRIQVGFVYLMEIVPRSFQSHTTSVWSVQEALIYALSTIYFWKISKDWFWFCLVGYVWNLISIVFLVWVPESPRYLVSVGKLEDARKALAEIAKWNRKELNWDRYRLTSEKMAVKNCKHREVLEITDLSVELTEAGVRPWIENKVGSNLTQRITQVRRVKTTSALENGNYSLN